MYVNKEEEDIRKLIRELQLLVSIEPLPREEIKRDLKRYLETGEVKESMFVDPRTLETEILGTSGTLDSELLEFWKAVCISRGVGAANEALKELKKKF